MPDEEGAGRVDPAFSEPHTALLTALRDRAAGWRTWPSVPRTGWDSALPHEWHEDGRLARAGEETAP